MKVTIRKDKENSSGLIARLYCEGAYLSENEVAQSVYLGMINDYTEVVLQLVFDNEPSEVVVVSAEDVDLSDPSRFVGE